VAARGTQAFWPALVVRAQSLKYLNAFHKAARHQSFAAAADVLCITPSAVSHQVRTLEAQLGVDLFERRGHGMRLTEAGTVLLQHAEAIISQVEAAAWDLRAYMQRSRLRLHVPPFFASELLLATLPDLWERREGVVLEIATQDSVLAEHSWDADVSVIVAREPPPELQSLQLFPQSFVPACSPALLHRAPIHGEAEILSRILICHSCRPDLWESWAAARGLEPLAPQDTLRFESMVSAAHAAECGAGIVLISAPLAAGRFARGSLVQISDAPLNTGESYFLVARAPDGERASVAMLWHWLAEKFRQSPQYGERKKVAGS